MTEGRWGTLFLLCGLAAGLSACKLHDQVQVSRQGAALQFKDADSRAACLDGFEVSTRTEGVVWKMAADKEAKGCAATFPLVYGTVPKGLVESKTARRLRVGTDYEVRGTGSASYFGAFMLLPDGQVANRWTEY
jgi:hypothetical protein